MNPLKSQLTIKQQVPQDLPYCILPIDILLNAMHGPQLCMEEESVMSESMDVLLPMERRLCIKGRFYMLPTTRLDIAMQKLTVKESNSNHLYISLIAVLIVMMLENLPERFVPIY